MREKLIKDIENQCKATIADYATFNLNLDVEFNKFNTYDETSVVAPLHLISINNEGYLVGAESGEVDEYHLYELTTDSLSKVLNTLYAEWDKITFVFEDSESGAKPFIHFLVDSGIVDIESKNLRNHTDDYNVIVSYWIDTMGLSLEESVHLGLEFCDENNIKPIKMYIDDKETTRKEIEDWLKSIS